MPQQTCAVHPKKYLVPSLRKSCHHFNLESACFPSGGPVSILNSSLFELLQRDGAAEIQYYLHVWLMRVAQDHICLFFEAINFLHYGKRR